MKRNDCLPDLLAETNNNPRNFISMSEDKEKSNPIAGIYGLGVIGCTALMYPKDGFWLSLGESLIWPFYVATFIYDKFK